MQITPFLILGLIDAFHRIQGFDEGQRHETYSFILERALTKAKFNTNNIISFIYHFLEL